jgi:hypothetical protein
MAGSGDVSTPLFTGESTVASFHALSGTGERALACTAIQKGRMRLVKRVDLALFCIVSAVSFACVILEITIFLALAPPHIKNNPLTLIEIACFYAITPVTTFALGVYLATLFPIPHEDEQQALAQPAPRNYGSLGSTAR